MWDGQLAVSSPRRAATNVATNLNMEDRCLIRCNRAYLWECIGMQADVPWPLRPHMLQILYACASQLTSRRWDCAAHSSRVVHPSPRKLPVFPMRTVRPRR